MGLEVEDTGYQHPSDNIQGVGGWPEELRTPEDAGGGGGAEELRMALDHQQGDR